MHFEVQGSGHPVVLMAGLGGLASAHLVGHSTGGLVAQVLALDHPARVDRMVLSATWARPDRRFRDLFEVRRVVLERAGFAAYNTMARLAGDAPINFDATTEADLPTAVALTLNNRPRKTLNWKTPAEAFNDYLQSVA